MFTDDPGFDLRYTVIEDSEVLKGWLEERETLKWFPQSSEGELGVMIQNWIGFSRFKASLTAIYKNQPIGIGTLFLMPYRKVAHMAMVYLIVAPEYRRRGVGLSLVKNLRHLAKTRFRLESLFAEYYEGCPGIPLLQKAGFSTVTVQPGFAKLGGKLVARRILEVSL